MDRPPGLHPAHASRDAGAGYRAAPPGKLGLAEAPERLGVLGIDLQDRGEPGGTARVAAQESGGLEAALQGALGHQVIAPKRGPERHRGALTAALRCAGDAQAELRLAVTWVEGDPGQEASQALLDLALREVQRPQPRESASCWRARSREPREVGSTEARARRARRTERHGGV